jgi:hypothetical protein
VGGAEHPQLQGLPAAVPHVWRADANSITFITHSAASRQILDHIGVESEPPNIAPARGPPLWEDCDAQMVEGKQLADRQSSESARLQNRTKSVDALVLEGGRWTAHDLRRTASTLMSQLGISNDVINECENHIKQGMSGVYIQDRREAEQVKAFDALGQKLDALTSA